MAVALRECFYIITFCSVALIYIYLQEFNFEGNISQIQHSFRKFYEGSIANSKIKIKDTNSTKHVEFFHGWRAKLSIHEDKKDNLEYGYTGTHQRENKSKRRPVFENEEQHSELIVNNNNLSSKSKQKDRSSNNTMISATLEKNRTINEINKQKILHIQRLKNGSKMKRKLIVILAQGRSGSSLLAEMFNRDVNAFYLFEPLITVERFNKIIHFEIKNKTTLEMFKKEAESFLTGVISCKSNKEFKKYMGAYDEFGSRSRTAAFERWPFRLNKTRFRIDGDKVLITCSNITSYTVFKELEFRVPDKSIRTYINLADKLDVDLRVIHLLRDPRAYLHSQFELGWFFENSNKSTRKMETYVKSRCIETLSYTKEVEDNKETYKDKMKFFQLRFEDLITYPELVLQKLSNVTGINVFQNSVGWFKKVTSKNGIGGRNRYQDGPRNATLIKDFWRKRIKSKLLDTIQNDCLETMNKFGYKKLEKHLLNDEQTNALSPFIPIEF